MPFELTIWKTWNYLQINSDIILILEILIFFFRKLLKTFNHYFLSEYTAEYLLCMVKQKKKHYYHGYEPAILLIPLQILLYLLDRGSRILILLCFIVNFLSKNWALKLSFLERRVGYPMSKVSFSPSILTIILPAL